MRSTTVEPNAPPLTMSSPGEDITQVILSAIKNIRFGSVEIIIQDAKVVLIERKEKIRFGKKTQ